MPFEIVRCDITTLGVDAIVNAANPQLEMGGGVCGAIFTAAGPAQLAAACRPLAPIATGQAVITPGFSLPARYVIHTAGPVYHGGNRDEEAQLCACYVNSLALARENGCVSVAFPLISSGIYGYPKQQALQVATEAIAGFLAESETDMAVLLAVYDKASFALSQTLLGGVQAYIDENYVATHSFMRQKRALPKAITAETDMDAVAPPFVPAWQEAAAPPPCAMPAPMPQALDELVGQLDEGFSQTLLRLIDAKGQTDAEVYKRANIDRKHFSKIRGNPTYTPSKRTALAFAVALRLTRPQTADLLARAGYALSHSRKLDVIVEYFIQNEMYDIYTINEVLFQYDEPLLGG